jgi:hypothetical protein
MAWSDLADKTLQVVRDCLGTSATYTPADENFAPYAITGVETQGFQGVDPETGTEVQSFKPTFTVRGADMSAPPGPGDTLLLNSVTYSIIEAKKDGEGGITLILND